MAAAARTVMRSATSSARTAAARVVSGTKSKPQAASPFRIPTQKPLSARIFRSPVEMSAVSVHTMLPYHSATASALLTSMLSVAPRSYGWTLEVCSCGRPFHKSSQLDVMAAAKPLQKGINAESRGNSELHSLGWRM